MNFPIVRPCFAIPTANNECDIVNMGGHRWEEFGIHYELDKVQSMRAKNMRILEIT